MKCKLLNLAIPKPKNETQQQVCFISFLEPVCSIYRETYWPDMLGDTKVIQRRLGWGGGWGGGKKGAVGGLKYGPSCFVTSAI